MVVVLPFDTIRRILYRVSTPPSRAGDYADRSSPVSSDTEKLPPLASNIIAALERSNREKDNWINGGKHVGPLQPDDFLALAGWCRAVRLRDDGYVIDDAVAKAAPE